MRLTDRYEAPKGIEDLAETQTQPSDGKSKKGFEKPIIDSKAKRQADQTSKENAGNAKDDAAHEFSAGSGGKSSQDMQEFALFDNPGNLLEKLADEARGSQLATDANPPDGNISDPFDRINRRAGKSKMALKPALQAAPAAPLQSPKVTKPLPSENVKPAIPDQKQELATRASSGEAGDKPTQQDTISKQTLATLDQSKKEDKTHDKDADKAHEQDHSRDHEKDEEAKNLREEISSAVSNVSRDLPLIEVKATPEGVLISLTDDADFGMFEVGSAKPRPELVLTMEKIGKVLSDKVGNIVIRGHTDSRPYKSRVYDNWRLSAARAQMAYYMLLRGGVGESRVVAIEGHADRDPRVPSDTLAPANRRIDILLKEATK
jgi:chemotaxis protein MotB